MAADAPTRDLIGRPFDPTAIRVDPMPAQVVGSTWFGAGRRLLRDPTTFFADQRAGLGDTFVADVFGYRLLCLFSPAGVRALYGLPEDQASFNLATFSLLRLKLPDDLFLERRATPHSLFANQDVNRYLGNLRSAIDLELDDLGPSGTFEAFAEAKRLAHRLGFASWVCEEAASTRYLERLIPPFDELDAAESFVHPRQAFRTRRTDHARERAALGVIEEAVAEIWADRQRAGVERGDMLERAVAGFAADHEADEAVRQAARDLTLIHLGSQSNLFAALAWTLVDLLLRPDLLDAVVAGDDALLERCAHESIRMAQRSITLRYVLQPLTLALEDATIDVGPGAYLATMLSVTNTSAGPDGELSRFDPEHYDGRRLDVPLATKELVSTFGHGPHSCPAARFSVMAIRLAVRSLVDRYDLRPEFTDARPSSRQLGGVARADAPCPVRFRTRG